MALAPASNRRGHGRKERGGEPHASGLRTVSLRIGIATAILTIMKSVYIETSVISYYTGRPSRDVVVAGHQQSTMHFWAMLGRELSPFVSALAMKEAGKGDPELAGSRLDAIQSFPVLRTTREAEQLAQALLDAGAIPAEYPEDALHIAVATAAGMDFIVTWNFAHINNPFTKMLIRRTVENAGYESPEIVSPDAFLGEEI